MSSSTTTARPARWKRLGGGGIVVAGALLVIAVIVSFVFEAGDSVEGGLFFFWLILRVIASIVAAIAIFALAGWGPGGIVGGSAIGKVALYVFAVFQLIYTVLRVLVVFVAVERDQTSLPYNQWPTFIAFIAAAVAAVVIARAGHAKGWARWTLLVWVAFGAVSFIIQSTMTSPVVFNVLELISAVLVIVVGLSYRSTAITTRPVAGTV